MRYRITRTFAASAVALALVACGRDQPQATADRVLTNGRIYTVNDSQPWAEAVVIEEGKFIYVGDTALRHYPFKALPV